MSNYIRTIKDLEAATYGVGNFPNNDLLKAAGIVGGLHTPHDGATGFSGVSGITNLYGVIYGQKVWSMLNQEVNALSMLAKRPYTSSGWRILKSRPSGGSGSSFTTTQTNNALGTDNPGSDLIGGVPENESLSNLTAVAPVYDKLFMSPKTVAHLFEFSELAMEMAKIDDGIGDIRAIVREDMGKL